MYKFLKLRDQRTSSRKYVMTREIRWKLFLLHAKFEQPKNVVNKSAELLKMEMGPMNLYAVKTVFKQKTEASNPMSGLITTAPRPVQKTMMKTSAKLSD